MTTNDAAAPLRDALRGLVEAIDEYRSKANRSDVDLVMALTAARRALDEPIEHPVLDREVEG
jgi:hypothetical protein